MRLGREKAAKGEGKKIAGKFLLTIKEGKRRLKLRRLPSESGPEGRALSGREKGGERERVWGLLPRGASGSGKGERVP